MSGNFRAAAKTFFLTWSQANELTREDVRDKLIKTSSDGETGIKFYIVAREEHKEEGIHFHSLVSYKAKKDVRNANYFDIRSYHPNIKTAKKRGDEARYAGYLLKPQEDKEIDKNPLVFGDLPKLEGEKNNDTLIVEALERELKEKGGGLQYYWETCPWTATTRKRQIEEMLRHQVLMVRRKKQNVVKFNLDTFVNAPQLPNDWKVLYIWGDTRLGKSKWARALLPEAGRVTEINRLGDADATKGLIFDDVATTGLSAVQVIHLVEYDDECDIRVLYGSVRIPEQTKKIFTYNNPVEQWVPPGTSETQLAAIKSRMHIIHVTNKLY